MPDESIAALYPVEENYIIHDGGTTRSPKSLKKLCIDAVCRHLPQIEGDLPTGIPQDLVDDLLESLVRHSALNATTLRCLRNCELSELPLSKSRGVSDDWLIALTGNNCKGGSKDGDVYYYDDSDIEMSSNQGDDNQEMSVKSSSSSTDSFHSAISTQQKSTQVETPGLSMSLSQDYEFKSSVTTQLAILDLRGSLQVTDKGLLQLRDLGCLEVARLDNCYSIVGRGLLAFSNSHRLHTLSLSNCRCLTDQAITNISHLVSISVLSLDGCRCLTDNALVAISNLYDLVKLDLSQCDLITDDGLECLQSLHYVEELSLGWCRLISDKGVDTLTSQPNRGEHLESLSLARCQMTDIGVEHLTRLSALKALDLNGCAVIGSVALGVVLKKLENLHTLDVSYCPYILRSSWQGKINSLRSLDLCYSAVKNVHISRLSSLPLLEELNLDSCPVGDWSLAHLADNNVVPNLKSLDLADTDVTDEGLVHVAKMKNLEHLSLFYCEITSSGLRHLSNMHSLQALNLDSRDIGDSAMYHLRNLKNLKCLDVFSGRITDNGCSHIVKIQTLESLELCGGGISDFGTFFCNMLAFECNIISHMGSLALTPIGCHHLSKLQNLTSLNLSQNERITNIGASSLATLSKLKALNLSYTNVTSDALPYFKELINLQSLAIYGCKGIRSSSKVEELHKDLPSLKCMRLRVASDGEGTIEESLSDTNNDEDENESLILRDDDDVSFADEDSYISLSDEDESYESEDHDGMNQGDEDNGNMNEF